MGNPEAILSYRILLADDQEIFRNGIRNILGQQAEIHICGEVGNKQEFLQCINQAKPDLIILEIDLPNFNGLEIFNAVKRDYHQVKTLILTHSKKRELLYWAIKQEADGFILKEEPSRELLRALETIRKGGKFFSGLLFSELMTFMSTKNQLKPLLTSREKEILEYMAEGLPSKQIAQYLDISICTVHRHRYNIKKKLNLENMTDLIKYCTANKNIL
jgi:DNA-binding NarL/FixJ family response regulator